MRPRRSFYPYLPDDPTAIAPLPAFLRDQLAGTFTPSSTAPNSLGQLPPVAWSELPTAAGPFGAPGGAPTLETDEPFPIRSMPYGEDDPYWRGPPETFSQNPADAPAYAGIDPSPGDDPMQASAAAGPLPPEFDQPWQDPSAASQPSAGAVDLSVFDPAETFPEFRDPRWRNRVYQYHSDKDVARILERAPSLSELARVQGPPAPLQMGNGEYVEDSASPDGRLQIPAGVDIQRNLEIGRELSKLPLFQRYDAMVELFSRGQRMDFQRMVPDGVWQYANAGNFNYGAVAAAAGIPLDHARAAAGLVNLSGGGPKNGPFFNAPVNDDFVNKGYNAFRGGHLR